MKEQNQTETLHGLNGCRSPTNRLGRLLHEIAGEGTNGWFRSWHSGFLSSPGFSGVSPPLTKTYRNHDVICEMDH
jgi:hypothetical protein